MKELESLLQTYKTAEEQLSSVERCHRSTTPNNPPFDNYGVSHSQAALIDKALYISASEKAHLSMSGIDFVENKKGSVAVRAQDLADFVEKSWRRGDFDRAYRQAARINSAFHHYFPDVSDALENHAQRANNVYEQLATQAEEPFDASVEKLQALIHPRSVDILNRLLHRQAEGYHVTEFTADDERYVVAQDKIQQFTQTDPSSYDAQDAREKIAELKRLLDE